jgi:hypothetical protein
MRTPLFALVLAIAACDDEGTGAPPGPAPQIVAVAGPANGIVACDPAATGATCPLAITITFRLTEPEFVWKAYVRFQGDGTDRGVDRGYLVPYTIGKGTNDVQVVVNANVPPNLLRRGAQFTYSVRLVTGSGAESSSTTLSVSVP